MVQNQIISREVEYTIPKIGVENVTVNERRFPVSYPKIYRYFCFSIALIPILTFEIYYVFFHMLLRFPMNELNRPIILSSALTLLLGPGLYWARKRDASNIGKNFAIVMSTFIFMHASIGMHYAVQFGIMPNRYIGYITVILATMFAYSGMRWFEKTFIR